MTNVTHHLTRRTALTAAATLPLTSILPRSATAGDTAATATRVRNLLPALEDYVRRGLEDWHIPGAALGVTVGEDVLLAATYGLREAGKSATVDAHTVFQIGSTTKAFAAATLAALVDRKRLDWSDRVIDHDPDFRMHDPWVTREFRILDLLAQRSGLREHVLDDAWVFGFPPDMIAAGLRHAVPVSSFRSQFAYVNIPHLIAGRIVARRLGVPDWSTALGQTILDPLGMTETTATVAALEAAANHATGHAWFNGELTRPPLLPWFDAVGPAGALNSTLTDMLTWLRMQTGRGRFNDKQVIQAASLTETWRPRVELPYEPERFPAIWAGYANGWIFLMTPGGPAIWHNGGTGLFRAHVGFLPDSAVGFVILTNEGNNNLVDHAGLWFYDRVLGNPEIDYSARGLPQARAEQEKQAAARRRPDSARAPGPMEDYGGAYHSPILGDARVTIEGGILTLSFAALPRKLLLRPWNGDAFLVDSDDSRLAATLAIGAPGFVVFVRGPTGQASELRFQDAPELTLTRAT